MILSRLLVFFTICCFMVATGGHAFWWSESLSPKAERAKKLLDGFEQVVDESLKDFQVPGMSIAIVVDGHPVFVKGFGLRNKDQSERVTPDTLFAIGSCTKAFTSFAMGCLVDEGLLNWDMRVVDAVPEFRLWDAHATQNLTLRDLLCHRSGVPRHNFMWYNSKMSRQEILHRLRYLHPACDLRERFNYNDLMFLTTGIAIERVTNKSWEEVISQKILSPLGMTRTNFSSTEMNKMVNFATPYLEKEGKIKEMKMRDFSMIGPAGGINSTANDLSRWIQMQLNHGIWNQKSLISFASLKEMHAPQIVMTGYPESKEAQVHAYGLGWNVQSYRAHYNVSHDGGVDGFTSIVSLLPQDGIGVAILCNKNLTALPHFLTMNIFDRLLELSPGDWIQEGLDAIMKGKEAEKSVGMIENITRKKDTQPSHSLEQYVGTYHDPGYGDIEVALVDGTLQATLNGITYGLEHWHYDVFSISKESEDLILSRQGAKVSFLNNLYGEVEELHVPFEWNAPDIVFKRRSDVSHDQLAYLRKYSGIYEIYGYTVEVVLRDKVLFAMIPGQPIYELIPGNENEFTVKSLPGYTVRFVNDGLGKIQEVLLALPYGIVYSAKPKR